jgi:AcrR family transcriptional regulator
MPSPARQRILDAALGLIRERGIGRITTKEIALAAGAAEGSLFKNFGDKMGLLAELLDYELPEVRAWRAVAPPGQGDLVTALVVFMERAIDFYAAMLPIVAGSLADRELHRRYQELRPDHRSGPQLALELSAGYLRRWQQSGQLDKAADPDAMAAALCGGALMCAYIEQFAGAEQVPGGRGGFIQSLIGCVAGPYSTKGAPDWPASPAGQR